MQCRKVIRTACLTTAKQYVSIAIVIAMLITTTFETIFCFDAARARDNRIACFRVECLEPFLICPRMPQVQLNLYIHTPPRID
jgi:hypothetical protein